MGNYDFDLDLKSKNTMSLINNRIQKESRILEFGPANGRLTAYLNKEKHCKLTIVELDENSGKQAAEFAEKAFVGSELGNIENGYWYNEQEKFDYILFADVLEHLRIPKEILKKCKKMLKPEGKILVSIPNVTHNSILIAMLNDRFDYADTGLLDRTHIHFFTKQTFCEMVQEAGFSISYLEPIYSRVGDNEISARYAEVPIEVEQYLRKRPEGSVYQYVAELEVSDNLEQETISVTGLAGEEYVSLEAQIFYKNADTQYDAEKRVRKKYFDGEKVVFSIDLKQLQKPEILRLDPMECSGIVRLENRIVSMEDKVYTLKIEQTNAYFISGNVFIFDAADPYIEFAALPKEFENAKLEISFCVLGHQMAQEKYQILAEILQSDVSGQGELLEIKNNELFRQSEMIQEMKEYIAHLEKDIALCGAEIKRQDAMYKKTIEYKIKRLLKKEKNRV